MVSLGHTSHQGIGMLKGTAQQSHACFRSASQTRTAPRQHTLRRHVGPQNVFARSNRCSTSIRARKKTEIAEEWAALAQNDHLVDEQDPDLQASINEVCNKGLRYMLRGETDQLLDYRDELSRFGQYFSDRGNIAGATFIYVLYKMTEHILPKQMVNLEGIYLKAFEKLFSMLEDSGWQLSPEPEEGQEVDLIEEPEDADLQRLS